MVREMKPSQAEWIGEIPASWNIVKIGSVFHNRTEKVSDYDFEALSVTKNGIFPQLENVAKSDNHSDRKRVLKGDFVINSRSDRKMSSGVSPLDGSVSLINTVLYSSEISPEYTKYLLKNHGFAEEFYRWGTGIVADLWSTNFERMKRIAVPYPNLNEQLKIANFLDEKVFLIDSIIANTRESVEEFKKYKRALITETVTKGLKSNIEMKDSGITWIGTIPKEWDVLKLKSIGNSITGVTYSPGDISPDSEGTLVLRSSNIQSGALSLHDNVYITKEITGKQKLRDGDILICSRNGSRKLIGKNILIDEKMEGESFGAFMTVFRTTHNKFVQYFLNSSIFLSQAGLYMSSTINQLTIKTLNNFVIALPPTAEQEEIVAYLNSKCAHIDSLIEQKQQLLVELEAYKKSFIYEYVTGKKEVL